MNIFIADTAEVNKLTRTPFNISGKNLIGLADSHTIVGSIKAQNPMPLPSEPHQAKVTMIEPFKGEAQKVICVDIGEGSSQSVTSIIDFNSQNEPVFVHSEIDGKEIGLHGILKSNKRPLKTFTKDEQLQLAKFGIKVGLEIYDQNVLDDINRKSNLVIKTLTGKKSDRFKAKLTLKNLK